MAHSRKNVSHAFEVVGIALSVPNCPEFSEMSYSVCVERLGQPETFHQTRWFSPSVALETRSIGPPSEAWAASTPQDPKKKKKHNQHQVVSREEADSSIEMKWSRTNYVCFTAELHPTASTTGRRFQPKSSHPLVFSVKVSPRHPSMGISSEHTSTKLWSSIVKLDISDVACAENGTMPLAMALTKANRGDPTASSQVICGVELRLVMRATEQTGPLQMAPPPVWPHFVSKFPYLFVLDQFVLSGRFAAPGGEANNGAGATQLDVLNNQVVHVEVQRKHNEAGLVRRISKRAVRVSGGLTAQPFTSSLDAEERHVFRSLSVDDVKTLDICPSSTISSVPLPSNRNQRLRRANGDAKTDGHAVLVIDHAIPDDWVNSMESFAANSNVPLRVIKLHLETGDEFGQAIPRNSKRTHLQFGYGGLDSVGRAPPTLATSAPLNCSTQLYGFENFPPDGVLLVHTFPDLVELRYRVRRFVVPKYGEFAVDETEKVVTTQDLRNVLGASQVGSDDTELI